MWRSVRLIGIVVGWVLIVAGAAGAQTADKVKARVAVLDFDAVNVPAAEASAVTDQLRNDLVNLRVFIVLDRAQTEKVLGELAFQQGGATDPGQAIKLGKLLNVEYIVTGRVTSLGGAYQVNVQMIDVRTAEIERSESILHRGDILGLLSGNMATIAAHLANVEPGVVAGAPAPAPQPKTQVRGSAKPAWALWSGVAGLVVGIVMESSALSTNQQAADTAATAIATANATLYSEAQSLRADAESTQTTALLLGGIGVGLLVYYALSDGDSSTAAWDGDPSPQAGFRVALESGSVGAAYSWRF